MAVSKNNASVISTTNGTTVTVSYTVTSGSNLALIAIITGVQGAAVTSSSLSYNGNGMTAIAGGTVSHGANATLRMESYQLVNPATGSHSFSAVLTGYDQSERIIVIDCANVHQTTPCGTVATNTGSSTAPTSGSVTLPSNGLIWGGASSEYTTGATVAGSGTTLDGTSRAGTGWTVSGGDRGSTGNLNWTLASSARWISMGIPINAAAGASFIAGLPVMIRQAVSNAATY